MALKKLLPAAFAAATLFAAASAGAAALVTLNPQAENGLGAAGVIDASTPAFKATGFDSALDATLVINANSGIASYTETGSLLLKDFTDLNLPGPNKVVAGTNVGSGYDIFALFSLTGVGQWSGSQFNAAPGANLTIDLYADFDGGANFEQDLHLGTGTIDPGYLQFAFAIALGFLNPGDSGDALTSLTATVDFTPAAGTEGLGGFFEAPSPFAIDINLGNVGGNQGNTVYSVGAADPVTGKSVVTITTTAATANATFIAEVPEPSALALVGLALAGAGVASRRRKVADKV